MTYYNNLVPTGTGATAKRFFIYYETLMININNKYNIIYIEPQLWYKLSIAYLINNYLPGKCDSLKYIFSIIVLFSFNLEQIIEY